MAKLQPATTQSGSSVFKVDYFQRAAFLAQSPQLAKETCIITDFECVYENGSGMCFSICAGFEIERVKRQFPHNDLVFPDETVILPFPGGIKLLKESSWTEEDGEEIDDYEDLSHPAEVRWGQLVKEKFNTDYYILDKFPAEVRPFYKMLDPENPILSNSLDLFLRGEEILSGGQRLHWAKEIEKRVTPASTLLRWRIKSTPSGERGNRARAACHAVLSLFPRDPRSFPDAVPAAGIHIHNDVTLPHMDRVVGYNEETVASQDNMRLPNHPPLKDLIASVDRSGSTRRLAPPSVMWNHTVTPCCGIQCDDSHTQGNKTVQRKVRAADRDGMAFQMIKGEVSAELRAEIDEHILAWQDSREGTQVHTTKLRPWRTANIACGLISPAKLSPERGYQIKWALVFPGSPQGIFKCLTSSVVTRLARPVVEALCPE
ncbi:hypothetical protein HWV62_42902 [Athelia sp. TMB]|nr:hypothetical protein HWV62_42902 [Athelia sp. TMB]